MAFIIPSGYHLLYSTREYLKKRKKFCNSSRTDIDRELKLWIKIIQKA